MLQLFRPRRVDRTAPEPTTRRNPALALLVETGRLGAEDAARAANEAENAQEPLAAVLDRLELVSGEDYVRLMADHYGLQVAEPQDYPTVPLMPGAFSSRFLRQRWVLPLAHEEETLWLAMADPSDEATLQAARLASECEVVPVVAAVADLKAAYDRFFESGECIRRGNNLSEGKQLLSLGDHG